MISPRLILAEIARVLTGVVLIVSGLLKAIDPVGSALKIGEYLAPVLDERWAWSSLITLTLSFVLCAGEFLLGAFLLMGIYRRLSARLSVAFFAGMTLISLYSLLADPVSDCGCFGDAIHLTPLETLLKNLLLLPLSYLVLRDARGLRHLYSRRERWLPAVLAVVGIVVFMERNYRHLPLVDFRPYRVGTNLGEAIAEEDSTLQARLLASTRYLYERGGVTKAFTPENLPDSSWHFVRVQDGEDATYRAKYDFAPMDSLGNVCSEALLTDPGVTLLLLAPHWSRASEGSIDEINELYTQSLSMGYRFYGVTASSTEEIAAWRYLTGASYPMLHMDAIPIRTMIRAYPGLLVLRGGQIIDKRSYVDLPTVEEVTHYLHRLREPDYIAPAPSLARSYLLLAWGILLILGFLRFWARKLHLTLYLKKRIHYPYKRKRSMRKNIVAGNWKMNKTLQEGTAFISELKTALSGKALHCEVIIGAPFIHLASIASLAEGSPIGIAAENCADKAEGAYTGEVSAAMVASTGARYVILGHSERRAYYGEDNAILTEKVRLALANGLTPIFCIGEVKEEREAGKHFQVVEEQLAGTLFSLSPEEFSKVILAYEPVWAIGTGLTATSAQAQEIHAHIRHLLVKKYGEQIANDCSILYGGSCNASNAAELFAQPDVDGGLIGGASLSVEKFLPIIEAFH